MEPRQEDQARLEDGERGLSPICTLPVPILAINLERDAERMAGTRAAFAGLPQFELRRSPGVVPALPDAAKTYLDSARRIDPANSRIDSLARRIRDREHQVLQTETTIK